MRYRVTRVLVLEGEKEWINAVLERSFVSPEKPVTLPANATLTETSRTFEELK